MVTLDEILGDTAAYIAWELEEGETTAEVSREVLNELSMPDTSGSAERRKPSAAKPAVPVAPPPATVVVEPASQLPASPARPETGNAAALLALANTVKVCTACPLHKDRKQAVPGQGNPTPEILFVGEAPGADEDEQGLAFVGRAGQLLTKMIEAMGYTREEVFIANVNKCRPPNNRKPLREEMDACLPYLRQQVAILKPKVIVAMGATAVEGLVPESVSQKISALRGNWLSFEGTPLMPTYHPAYLLRNPSMKKPVWEDLQTVLKRLGRPIPKRSSSN
ncbi:MAG: uracil-DNA glycosylase [Kiritimatiellia bacterium]